MSTELPEDVKKSKLIFYAYVLLGIAGIGSSLLKIFNGKVDDAVLIISIMLVGIVIVYIIKRLIIDEVELKEALKILANFLVLFLILTMVTFITKYPKGYYELLSNTFMNNDTTVINKDIQSEKPYQIKKIEINYSYLKPTLETYQKQIILGPFKNQVSSNAFNPTKTSKEYIKQINITDNKFKILRESIDISSFYKMNCNSATNAVAQNITDKSFDVKSYVQSKSGLIACSYKVIVNWKETGEVPKSTKSQKVVKDFPLENNWSTKITEEFEKINSVKILKEDGEIITLTPNDPEFEDLTLSINKSNRSITIKKDNK